LYTHVSVLYPHVSALYTHVSALYTHVSALYTHVSVLYTHVSSLVYCLVHAGIVDECMDLTSACGCVANAKCGWCGRSLEQGTCAMKSDHGDGPNSGVCDVWIDADSTEVGEFNATGCRVLGFRV
jgi:hypothetical protein